LLPENVKPIGLSTVCKQEVTSVKRSKSASEVALELTKTLEASELTDGLVIFISQFLGKQENEEELKRFLDSYFNKVDVVTVDDLNSQLILTESNKPIGTLPSKFCYIPREGKSTLYLNSSLSSSGSDDAFSEIAKHLYTKLLECLMNKPSQDQEKTIVEFVKSCLRVRGKELWDFFNEEGVQLDLRMKGFSKKLGSKIPECWHHR